MRFQQSNFTCGPASILNAFLALGARQLPTEKVMAQLAQCLPNTGADVFDVAAAITLLGFRVAETRSPEDVEFYIKQGCPVLLVAYQDTHWVTVVGLFGDRWVVVDSDNSRRNKKENGTFVLAHKDLQSNDYQGIAILGRHPAMARAKSRSRRAKPRRPARGSF
jgi:ABC-type bacteriocin/lantibiotic exporter with double-glycine peptidase domain